MKVESCELISSKVPKTTSTFTKNKSNQIITWTSQEWFFTEIASEKVVPEWNTSKWTHDIYSKNTLHSAVIHSSNIKSVIGLFNWVKQFNINESWKWWIKFGISELWDLFEQTTIILLYDKIVTWRRKIKSSKRNSNSEKYAVVKACKTFKFSLKFGRQSFSVYPSWVCSFIYWLIRHSFFPKNCVQLWIATTSCY